MIDIKLMTEQAYKTLQKNYKEVTQLILDHPSDSSWLKSYLGFEPYETKKYEIEDFELLNNEDYSKVALQNTILLYQSLKGLPRYILCNIRFWAWITFEKAYKQAINIIEVKESVVKSWWLPDNSRRDLMLQILGRGYFIAEVSFDETAEDNYYLTAYCLNNAETYRNLTYRNIGMLPNVSKAFLKACRQVSIDIGYDLSVNDIREAMKETSKVGSVMLIDAMSSDEVYSAIYPKIHAIATRKQ